MRALPSLSLEYLEATAFGNTAGPAGAAGAAASFFVSFLASSFFASFGAAAGAGAAAAGAGVASAPHWALRKSFHFWPLRVPAVFAAWYFALHSCEVRACAGDATVKAKPASAAAQSSLLGIFMSWSPWGAFLESRIVAQPKVATTQHAFARQKYN